MRGDVEISLTFNGIVLSRDEKCRKTLDANEKDVNEI
jgi:hypothetical protein